MLRQILPQSLLCHAPEHSELLVRLRASLAAKRGPPASSLLSR